MSKPIRWSQGVGWDIKYSLWRCLSEGCSEPVDFPVSRFSAGGKLCREHHIRWRKWYHGTESSGPR